MIHLNKNSCPEVFCKKRVLRNFTDFTGKHLCQSLFFNKVAGLGPVRRGTHLRFNAMRVLIRKTS